MLSIIAIGRKNELGKDNKLLWHLPEDLKRFKRITIGHPIIMGRKTFQSCRGFYLTGSILSLPGILLSVFPLSGSGWSILSRKHWL